jgi:hypothetical protein
MLIIGLIRTPNADNIIRLITLNMITLSSAR